MTDLDRAIAAAREAMNPSLASLSDGEERLIARSRALRDLLATLDAARGQAIWQRQSTLVEGAWVDRQSEKIAKFEAEYWGVDARCVYAAPPAAAVSEDVARDAARYRFLRNDSGNAFDDPVIQGKYIGSPKADWLTGEHADEAIDRAMLAAAERKGGES